MSALLPWVVVLTVLLAVCSRRRAPVVDRVEVFAAFAAADGPRFARCLPGDSDKALATFQRIGRVHLASAMRPCDEVTRSPFHTGRDFGDEDDRGVA